MSLTVKNWRLKELWHLSQDKELDLQPDYQRREAWTAKKKMVLIDSVARRIPINAITLYKTNESGTLVYEVIDGKQRLTTLFQFQADDLIPLREAVKDLSEEEEAEGKELAEKILDKKWSDLNSATRSAFLDYEVPTYIVEGSRASAVRAFRRMNADSYPLNPQEIRNAVFKDSAFLQTVRSLAEDVEKLASGADRFFVEWGVITPTQWKRMQDLQFLSELLCLQLKGPQEARRSLDDTYDEYFSNHGNKGKQLKVAEEKTLKALQAALRLAGPSLRPHNLDSEHGAYALVGAIFKRGIPTNPQLADDLAVQDVKEMLALFGEEVLLCQQAIKEADDEQVQRYDKEVREYASSLLGGQINSMKRRQTRIDILATLISERIAPVDLKNPTDLQRRLVWAHSRDKKCARCGKVVEFKDYDCGHSDPKAFGGRPITSNLRIEHIHCNRSAQAD